MRRVLKPTKKTPPARINDLGTSSPNDVARRRWSAAAGRFAFAVLPASTPFFLAAAASPARGAKAAAGFHVTTLELAALAAATGVLTAIYAVRTYVARKREREMDERVKNPYEQSNATSSVREELAAYRASPLDADSALERLQNHRRLHGISEQRPLRLSPKAFGGDRRTSATYNRLLSRFLDVAKASRAHAMALRELAPYATGHEDNPLTTAVLAHLVACDEAMRQILRDKGFLLSEADNRISRLAVTVFPAAPDRADETEEWPE